jgi:hypothetical protein
MSRALAQKKKVVIFSAPRSRDDDAGAERLRLWVGFANNLTLHNPGRFSATPFTKTASKKSGEIVTQLCQEVKQFFGHVDVKIVVPGAP